MSQPLTNLSHNVDGPAVAASTAGLESLLQQLVSLATVLGCPVLLLTAWYALACWIWPYRNCPGCRGTGQRRAPIGRAFRVCRTCNGTGGHLRLGRRIYHRYAARRNNP